MPRPFRPAAVVVVVVLLVLAHALPAAAQSRAVDYRPPLDAPVVDPFRPPVGPYAPGNRGIDYRAEAGQPVLAAADGEVVFVGPIAGSVHVVLLHADHVAGDVYLDPADLFAGEGPQVRLVPLEPLPEEEERKGLIKMLGGALRRGAGVVVGAGADALQGLVDLAKSELFGLVVNYLSDRLPHAVVGRVVPAILRAIEAYRRPCTKAGEEPPPDPSPPVLVRVSGLMSDSDAVRQGGGIGGVDAAAINSPGAPTYSFSYGDGDRWIEEGASYEGSDTMAGFGESGAELAAGLARIRREHPGREIVIVAHSQGGLIAREALVRGGSEGVSQLITLATPHNGSDVATAGHLISLHPGTADKGAALLEPFGLDPRSDAVHDLSEASTFISGLGSPPPGVQVTSITMAGDLLAPPPRAHLEGADNRVIGSQSLVGDHTAITGNPEAHREVRLALAGMAATCRSLLEHVKDQLRGELSSAMIDTFAPTIAGALALIPPGMLDALT